MPDIVSKVAES